MGVLTNNQVKPNEIVFVKVQETGYYEVAIVDTTIPDFDVILAGFRGFIPYPEQWHTKESAQKALSNSWKQLPQREVTISHKNSIMTKDIACKIILGTLILS